MAAHIERIPVLRLVLEPILHPGIRARLKRAASPWVRIRAAEVPASSACAPRGLGQYLLLELPLESDYSQRLPVHRLLDPVDLPSQTDCYCFDMIRGVRKSRM